MSESQSSDNSFTILPSDPTIRPPQRIQHLAPGELPARFQITFLFAIWIIWLSALGGVYHRAHRLAERGFWMESFAFGIVEYFMPLVLVIATGLCIGRRVLFADSSIGFRLLSVSILFMSIAGVAMLFIHCFDLPSYFIVVLE